MSEQGRGRPTTYTEALAQQICEMIAGGLTLKEISGLDDMPSRPAVYKWLAKHAEFVDMYARAREDRAELVADEVVMIADTEPDPAKARVRIDARKWWAAKVNPKKFGDKVQVGGDADSPIKHAVEVTFVEPKPD